MKNEYVQRLKSVYDGGFHDGVNLMFRKMLDFVTIALGRMGYGEKRLADFDEVLGKVYEDYNDLFLSDFRDKDFDYTYARANMDAELKQYSGSRFIPYEERYANLSYRRPRK